MKATIWHNPNCGTSRNVLARLQERGDVELEVIEYLKDPPSRARLAQLYLDAGLAPRDGLRLRGTTMIAVMRMAMSMTARPASTHQGQASMRVTPVQSGPSASRRSSAVW